MQGKSVEIVVQAEGDGALMWDHAGTMHIAADADALGRFAVNVATDDKTPGVPFGAPESALGKLASQVLTELGQPAAGDAGRACAVHMVLRVQEDEHGLSAAVYPPAGRPRLASGAQGLGALLHELAADDGQPKVRPGAPPDITDDILDRAGGLLSEYFGR